MTDLSSDYQALANYRPKKLSESWEMLKT